MDYRLLGAFGRFSGAPVRFLGGCWESWEFVVGVSQGGAWEIPWRLLVCCCDPRLLGGSWYAWEVPVAWASPGEVPVLLFGRFLLSLWESPGGSWVIL